MKEEKTHFYSDGYKLDASFYFPEESEKTENKPLVIICSGFQGLKDIHPERFARALTPLGYPCFGFDYRGFGKSEGKVGKVKLEEQVEDIINASFYAASHEELRAKSVVLVGWGMGGGLVLEAAGEVSELSDLVSGLVAVNGFYSAKRVQEAVRGKDEWIEFKEFLVQEIIQEAGTGEEKKYDPFTIYPLDTVSKEYVDNVLRKNEKFGVDVFLSFAESLLRFAPENRVHELKDVPILIAHGENNRLHPLDEAYSLYEKYLGEKDLHIIEEAGHTEWMFDDNEKFQGLVGNLDEWISKKVIKQWVATT